MVTWERREKWKNNVPKKNWEVSSELFCVVSPSRKPSLILNLGHIENNFTGCSEYINKFINESLPHSTPLRTICKKLLIIIKRIIILFKKELKQEQKKSAMVSLFNQCKWIEIYFSLLLDTAEDHKTLQQFRRPAFSPSFWLLLPQRFRQTDSYCVSPLQSLLRFYLA